MSREIHPIITRYLVNNNIAKTPPVQLETEEFLVVPFACDGEVAIIGLEKETERVGRVEWSDSLSEFVFSAFMIKGLKYFNLFEWNDEDCVYYNDAEDCYMEVPDRGHIL